MKINYKCSLAVIFLTAACLLTFSNTAIAGAERCIVNVINPGTTDTQGTVLILEKATVSGVCPGWGSRIQNNFLITDANKDAALAVALTAKSLGKTLFVHSLDDTFGNWSTLHQFYVGTDI